MYASVIYAAVFKYFSDMTLHERQQAIVEFRAGSKPVLVTSDVLSHGFDDLGITTVSIMPF